MLPFDQLMMVVSKLRFKDEMALKTVGLGKLAKTYDAYPLQEGGRKLLCLLPKGMDAQEARKLTPHMASSKLIVLQEGSAGLAKVWPSDQKVPEPEPAAKKDEVPAADLGEIVEE